MHEPLQVLIVEDEKLTAACLSFQLKKSGYAVSAVLSKGEDALVHIHIHPPDIVLMDILLEGQMDGIETARQILDEFRIPIIFLSGVTDKRTVTRARAIGPSAFISKPVKSLDIEHAIQLATQSLQGPESSVTGIAETEKSPFILNDCIFVKDFEKMVKISIEDILFIKAQRNYCRIHCKDKQYLLVITLRKLDEKLPSKNFLRIHRSFIINLSKITEIGTGHVAIAHHAIPLSKSLRDELLNRLQTI